MIVAVVSYIINRYFKRDTVNKRTEVSSRGQESVDQYNKRKREEALRKEAEKKKKLDTKVQEANPNYRKELTIDGRDPAAGDIIDPINVWSNYETRTYAGKVRHGEKVTLVKREGEGVPIETKFGLRSG